MKIIFAGTPDFAAVALKHLIDAGHEIALVLSQPDRPSGRGMKLTPSPVKKLALEHGIPVITPVTLSLKKAPEESARIHADLKAVGADLLVVAAYGLILPQAVLDCAKGIGRNGDIRAINIHGSLLPRWRGAAPVARAIESGDAESGVVLMKMEQGLDTGPMIRTVRTPITQEDTSDTLMMRLAELGAELLVESLRTPDELDWTPQPEEGVTYAEKLLKTEAVIDWTLPGNRIRQGRRPRQDLAGRSARALWSSRRSARHDEWSCDRLRRRRSSRHGSAEARQAQDGLRSLPSEPALYRW